MQELSGGGERPELSLAPYREGPLDEARDWSRLPPERRRARALRAASSLDRGELWSLTLAHLALHGAGVRPNTLRAYRSGLNGFLGWAEARVNLLRASPDDGARYVRTLEEQFSAAHVRVRLAAVRSLYRALRWAGATDSDPLVDARVRPDLTPPWQKREPYSEAELSALLEWADPQLSALILLGAHAGLRASEACALHWSDLDLEARRLVVREGKGGKRRVVTLSRSLVAALRELRAGPYPVLGLDYFQARRTLKALCQKAGVPWRGLHALRHAAGTRIVRESNDLQRAAEHLGHASIETTRIYAKWSDTKLREQLADW